MFRPMTPYLPMHQFGLVGDQKQNLKKGEVGGDMRKLRNGDRSNIFIVYLYENLKNKRNTIFKCSVVIILILCNTSPKLFPLVKLKF